MNQVELTQAFCTRPENYAWFLGAGASRSSGLPTATDIIWDLKLRHYCREENQDISRQDIQSEAVRSRIQSFLDSQGFPKLWADNEYTTYFEKIFGEDYDRQRKYLKAILSEEKATLSVGIRVMGALLAQKLCRIAFTTNFDTLIEKAVAEVGEQSLAPFHLEGSYAAVSALNNEEFPIYVKLHGDFRYESIKNLTSDLKQQNIELSASFVASASRFGLIVAGYSGRDESVVQLFDRALQSHNPFPHGLYWTGIKGAPPHPAVGQLLNKATGQGIRAHYIEIETFDALMLRLWRNIDKKSPAMDIKVRKAKASAVDIPMAPVGTSKPLLRLNGLPLLSLPSECLELRFNEPPDFKELRHINGRAEPSVILAKSDGILCWGTEKRIRQIFGSALDAVSPRAIPTNIFTEHPQLKGFIEEALGRSLAKDRPITSYVRYSKTHLIVQSEPGDPKALASLASVVGRTSGIIRGLFTQVTQEHKKSEQVRWSEALRLSIDHKDGKTWLLISPDIWVWPARARESATEFLSDRKRDRFNKKYNALLDAWIQTLFGDNSRNSEFSVAAFDDGNNAENPSFLIGSRTAFARRLTS